jgi:hypothetical protein
MPIRFTIEQRPLTDLQGHPAAHDRDAVSFHDYEAESADQAVRLFIDRNGGDLVGNIVTFPGFHAVATVRVASGVYTLQVTPSSQGVIPPGTSGG